MGAKTTRELMKTLTELGLSVALSGQIDMFFMYPQEKKKITHSIGVRMGPGTDRTKDELVRNCCMAPE